MSKRIGTYGLLRAARIAVSVAVLGLVTAAVAQGYRTWLSHWQIIPALIAGSGLWIFFWTGITVLLGRIYCSTACPMGTLQDIIARLPRRSNGYFFSEPHNVLRTRVMFFVLLAGFLSLWGLVAIFDPAQSFERIIEMCGVFFGKPLTFSLGAALGAILTMSIAAVLAWRSGRLMCNTLCPVGTLLGFVSRHAMVQPTINTDLCLGCNRCVRRCKAQCIDPNSHAIDTSRCVMCFDCMASCPSKAIALRRHRHKLQMPMLQQVATAKCSQNISSPQSVVVEKPLHDEKENTLCGHKPQ